MGCTPSGLLPDSDLSEIPSSQKRQLAKPPDYYDRKNADRDTAILKAYESVGYSMKAIGDYFGLHYSRVSRILLKTKGKT